MSGKTICEAFKCRLISVFLIYIFKGGSLVCQSGEFCSLSPPEQTQKRLLFKFMRGLVASAWRGGILLDLS